MVSLTCKIIFMNLCHREASLRNNCNHWNALIYVMHYNSFCLKSLRCLNVIYYISSRLQRFSPKIKGKIAPSPTTVQYIYHLIYTVINSNYMYICLFFRFIPWTKRIFFFFFEILIGKHSINGFLAPWKNETTVQASMYKPQDIHVIDLDIIFPDVDLHHVQNKTQFISWVFYFVGENLKKQPYFSFLSLFVTAECPRGVYGDNCTHSCKVPYFGHRCVLGACKCNRVSCKIPTQICFPTTGKTKIEAVRC